MIPKPPGCEGCPLYGDGKGFVPDEIIQASPVFVLGQNPGVEEEHEGRPFVGKTGETMMKEFFPRANLIRGENVSIGNAIRCRWSKNGKHVNELPGGRTLLDALHHCTRAYLRIPAGTRLVVAQGAVAWKALGNDTPISQWRGFLAPQENDPSSPPVTPTLGVLHLADLFRQPTMRIPSMRDWAKIPLFLRGEWPSPLPPRVTEPHAVLSTLEEIISKRLPTVIDTEYTVPERQLLILGVGARDGERVLGCQVGDWPRQKWGYRDDIRTCLEDIVGRCTVISQNFVGAEGPQLKKTFEIVYQDYRRIEDTMLAHAVLWSEWPHDLEFLASIYGAYPKLKHLAGVDPMLYNWGDVIDTLAVWEGLQREFQKDPQSKAIYEEQSLALIPLLLDAHERGIRVNQARVGPAREEYGDLLERARRLAVAHCGYPINVGSDDQLKHWLYTVERLPVQFKGKGRDKKVTIGADGIAALRSNIEPVPDFESEERDGVSYAAATERIQRGAHPLLEARVIYAGAQQALSHYITPLATHTRIHPEFHIHAQANARWSTVRPPLAQLPEDLRDIIWPDEGCVWLGWDWDQIELRVNAALSDDLPTLEAFDKGWDVHTLNMCDCFGYPHPPVMVKPWEAPENAEWIKRLNFQGKEDARRVFAKRFVYRLDYGGDPKNAGDIPGAKALGLDPTALVRASHRYLAAHPGKAAWRRKAIEYLATTRELPRASTFLGRHRKLTGGGNALRREYFDYPMQGSVSDVFNVTAVHIFQRLPLQWVYGMHDSQWWQARTPTDCTDPWVDHMWIGVKAIVTREWTINERKVRFPASWKQQCEKHKDCLRGITR